MSDIKLAIHAAALHKLNVLLLKIGCNSAFTVKMSGEPQNRFINGAFTNRHYYDQHDISELQKYALQRGVLIIPQIDLFAGMNSWKHANPLLLANCPSQLHLQGNIVNPLYRQTPKYVRGLIAELLGMFFPDELLIAPYIHLGGQFPGFECWEAD